MSFQRERARARRPSSGTTDAPLYPSQDSPGAGRVVEVTVRVMVGPDRSTVVVRRGGDPVVLHVILEHGAEADGLGAVVEAALREGVKLAK